MASLEAAPPRPAIVPGFIPNRGVGVLYAPEHTGKTFVALDLATRAAAGITIEGRASPRRLAIYLSGDDDATDLTIRAAAARAHHGLSEADPLRVFDFCPNLRDPGQAQAFLDWLTTEASANAGLQPLIILDTLSRALGADGDDGNPVHTKTVLSVAEEVVRRLNAAFLFLHHTTKAGTDYRGHNVLAADARFLIAADAKLGGLRLQSRKMKPGSSGASVLTQLTPVSFSLPGGGTAGTCMVEWSQVTPSPTVNVRSRNEPRNAAEGRALAIVADLMASAPITVTGRDGKPVQAVSLNEVRAAFRAVHADAPARSRALAKLIDRGALLSTADKQHVWRPAPKDSAIIGPSPTDSSQPPAP